MALAHAPRAGRVLVVEDEPEFAELLRYHLGKEGYAVLVAPTGGETRGIPVIIVTGRVEETDKVLGFELGAEDYVTKPFSPRELVSRIRAVLRRATRPVDGETPIRVGDLRIDRERFEVTLRDRIVVLTPKEFELLATLAAAPGRVFRRDHLLDRVWGQDGFVEPRTIDVHLGRLRAKFECAGLEGPPIETVRGVGYRFRDPERPRP